VPSLSTPPPSSSAVISFIEDAKALLRDEPSDITASEPVVRFKIYGKAEIEEDLFRVSVLERSSPLFQAALDRLYVLWGGPEWLLVEQAVNAERPTPVPTPKTPDPSTRHPFDVVSLTKGYLESNKETLDRLRAESLLREDFRLSLPAKPYVCDEKSSGLKIRPRDSGKRPAVGWNHIQPNHPDTLRWLVFDVDHLASAGLWEDVNLPRPHMIVTNPNNGHSHWLYRLATPVYLNRGSRSAPIRYLQAIKEGFYRKHPSIDQNYAGLIAKNPLSTKWTVTLHPGPGYDLADLAEYVELRAPERKPVRDVDAPGRNCDLFHRVRQWAYRQYQGDSWTRKSFEAHVLEQVRAWNTYRAPLPISEELSIARSVSRWCFTRYTGQGSQDVDRDHQRHAQKAQAKGRRTATEAKITRALSILQELDESVTADAVARLAGIGKRTVERHKHLLPKRHHRIKRKPDTARARGPKPPLAYQMIARKESGFVFPRDNAKRVAVLGGVRGGEFTGTTSTNANPSRTRGSSLRRRATGPPPHPPPVRK
jgi:hypothetical protein